MEQPSIDEIYKKLQLFSGADEGGKYWEIEGTGKALRENDLVELANWIAIELGWIKRS